MPSKISTARLQPSSLAIFAASSVVRALYVGSETTFLIAAPRSSGVSVGSRLVPTPHFLSVMRWAMSIWSAKTGVTMVGVPAPSDAWVVPMPPWWTAQEHCGNNHSWGAAFMKKMFSSQYFMSSSSLSAPFNDSEDRPAHPATMTPRWPAICNDRTANTAMCSSDFTLIEPQPMQAGAGPFLMKSSHRCRSDPTLKKLPPPCLETLSCSSLLIAHRPVMMIPLVVQSDGAAQKASLYAISAGVTSMSCLNMSWNAFSPPGILSRSSWEHPASLAAVLPSSYILAWNCNDMTHLAISGCPASNSTRASGIGE
mmetsp:Transcript_105067/g.322033  ORF Transcript_105067/g.322033 Transcript_105067/m.322033 type:complete len:311 (-) Transcript_105067:371-1303(-)